MKYLFLIILSLTSFVYAAIDAEEVAAMNELKAQEAAIVEAQKKTVKPAPVVVPAPEVVATPVSARPLTEKDRNKLCLSINEELRKSKPRNYSSLHVYPQPNYRLKLSFFERLGPPKGQLVRCPASEHGYHLLDEGVRGIVLLDKNLKHADYPPLSGMSIEARDYVQSLTLRSDLRIHMYTYGYVVYEDNGIVLTVEIKD